MKVSPQGEAFRSVLVQGSLNPESEVYVIFHIKDLPSTSGHNKGQEYELISFRSLLATLTNNSKRGLLMPGFLLDGVCGLGRVEYC